MRSLFFCILALAFTACGESAATAENTTTSETVQTAPDRAGEVFGAEEDFSGAMSISELVGQLAGTDTLTNVSVQGEVKAVCQMKGCWMTMAGDEEMMVKFKDYGFFMPKDIDGREVVMHGKAFYTTTSVDELRHYAEDAGKSAEEIAAITEPKQELHFLASGVLLAPEEASAQ